MKEDNTYIEDEEQNKRKGHQKGEEKVTREEIEEAIKKFKNEKTPGFDKATTKIIKEIVEMKGNGCWKSSTKHVSRRKYLKVVPIHKKRDKQCNNYIGIMLLSIPLKIYERIIELKLRNITEWKLKEAQSGLRKGRVT